MVRILLASVIYIIGCVSLAQSDTCQIPVVCDNADGSSSTKTIVLPTDKDIRVWKRQAAKAKRQRENQQRGSSPASQSHCSEPGWLTGQGGKYQYMVCEATLTWENARKCCMKKGADLAYNGIRVGDNFRYITDRIRGKNLRGLWIGLTDNAKEGEWKWLDGQKAENVKWGNNQPDNANGNQNCAWISPGVGYNLDDGECSAQFFPLCERLI